MSRPKFIYGCVINAYSPDKIGDFVDLWYRANYNFPLSEFLGMTDDEYATWVANPDSLLDIIADNRGILESEEGIALDKKYHLKGILLLSRKEKK